MCLWPSGNEVATDGVVIFILRLIVINCSLLGGSWIYYYHHASLILLWLHRV